jgi:hypothetical protein
MDDQYERVRNSDTHENSHANANADTESNQYAKSYVDATSHEHTPAHVDAAPHCDQKTNEQTETNQYPTAYYNPHPYKSSQSFGSVRQILCHRCRLPTGARVRNNVFDPACLPKQSVSGQIRVYM